MTTQPTSPWWPWTRDWWVAPLLVIEVGGGIGANHADTALHMALGGALSGLAAVGLLLWRRWPLPMLVLNAVIVLAYFATGQDNGPILFTPPVAVFLATRSRPPRSSMPWVVVAIAVGVVGLVLRTALWSGWSAGHAFGQSLVTVAFMLAAAAFGSSQRTRYEARAEQARRAASEEQLRMAQDLHDGVGHGLAVIAMQAGVALHVLDTEPAKARESLEAIRDTSRESLEALRAEIGRLAPVGGGDPTTHPPGPDAPRRPAPGLEDLPALIGRIRAGGLAVTLEDHSGELPQPVGATAYLVVQEALTNVLRHSGATTARVQLVPDDGALVVSVTDNGHGGAVTEGMGLRGMRTRVEALGGTLRVGRGPEGFTVWARIPVDATR